MTEVVAVSREGDVTAWEVRRDGRSLGAAWTRLHRGAPLLDRLEVPEADAADAFDALLSTLARGGAGSVAVDVRVEDPVLTAAIAGRGLPLGATQMRLDLSRPVDPPSRVELRPMTAEEFRAYRGHLVTAYAQEILGFGGFADLAAALDASERSTVELLPDGPDTPGHHLWSAYDGDEPVAILWIHAAGTRAFVYDIEVHEDRRRRGYGREVLDAGALAARDLGAEELGLNVFGHNEGARAMYEQAGYETTERSYRIPL
jgi:ribosomal protein S18 acetylase RimI-like enzyme